MLGNDKYKVNIKVDMSISRNEALVIFYLPLIGRDAYALYNYMLHNGSIAEFENIDTILNILNISIDTFENALNKLNEYHLLFTYKKDGEELYIFELLNPLTLQEFIKDDIFVRNYILIVGGNYYQKVLSHISISNEYYEGYQNISKKLDYDILHNWSIKDESFFNDKNNKTYDFNTIFDINILLRDMSSFLFPLKYRTYDNLKEIATLADLYNISYDKMRTYISKIVKTGEDNFDLKALKKLCISSLNEFHKINEDEYDTSCLNYLINLQNGKEVSPFDKRIIYNLAHDYHLNTPVINVLLRHCLRQCDNHLYENYIYPIASDLHRNDIQTSSQALARLDRFASKKKENDILPSYDDKNNPDIDLDRLNDLLKQRGD